MEHTYTESNFTSSKRRVLIELDENGELVSIAPLGRSFEENESIVEALKRRLG